jgi:uncharacterized membrane protein
MDESRRPFDYATAAGIAILFAIGVWGYVTLPPRIPTHFNLAGQATNWGASWTILALPLSGAFVALLLWVVPKFQIRPNLPFRVPEDRQDVVNALTSQMTAALSFAIVSFFIPIELELIAAARNASLSFLILPTVFAMLVCTLWCVGFYIARMYRASR